FQQAVTASEDGRKQLFDDLRLANDDLLQFLLHQQPMLPEFLKDVSQTALFVHVAFQLLVKSFSWPTAAGRRRLPAAIEDAARHPLHCTGIQNTVAACNYRSVRYLRRSSGVSGDDPWGGRFPRSSWRYWFFRLSARFGPR